MTFLLVFHPFFGVKHRRNSDNVSPWEITWRKSRGGSDFRPKNRRNFPSTNLKLAALCHSTSSCFFLAEKQNKAKLTFIWQANNGLERSWEDEAREKLKGLKRKEFSFTEPLTAVGDS